MENLQKIMSLYKSGRFECDLFFYSKLYQIANELNLYQQLDGIQKNKSIVEKMGQLTKKHLIALEQQDNEEKALEIIKQINKYVSQIDTSFVKGMLDNISAMGGKSYESKIISYVKSQPFKKLYSQIFDRIMNNVHDPALRLEDLLLMSIFMSKNGDKIANFVKIYNNVLEHGVNQLKKFRANYDYIRNNPELEEQKKVKDYLKGSHIIMTCLLRLNQIYKLLSGDSKFGIKLNAYKKDVQASLPKNEESRARNHPYAQFKAYLVNGEQLPHVCSLCLCVGEDHHECLNTIRIFYQRVSD